MIPGIRHRALEVYYYYYYQCIEFIANLFHFNLFMETTCLNSDVDSSLEYGHGPVWSMQPPVH